MSSVRRGGHVIYSLRTSVLEDIATELAQMAGVGRPSPTTKKPGSPAPTRTAAASLSGLELATRVGKRISSLVTFYRGLLQPPAAHCGHCWAPSSS